MEPESDIFGDLRNPCIYSHAILRTLVYLEPEASSKACRKCKISCIFKHFQGYLSIFRDIDKYLATLTGMQLGGEGRPFLPFWKIGKSVKFSIQKVVLRVSRRKNSKMFPCGASFSVFFFWQTLYGSALVPQTSHFPLPSRYWGIFTHIETLLRHTQTYFGIFSTLYNPRIFTNLPYSELIA